ncbi:DUF3007 family protein [Anaplasma marginale]|uniref:DUF3007 family protein n=1 Tax=Anaplasma marginale TaxID=770 RepID=UPI0005B2F56A|nr:DUF3007 family protein [Anaplasma marginale]
MRRIDAIAITLGFFVAGGVMYLILQAIGIDAIQAGIWTQAALIGGLGIWVITYIFRFSQGNMTYNQQLKDYEDAVLQKRLEEMTPEEIEKLQAEVEAEKKS